MNTPKTTQELPQEVCKVCTDCIEEFCHQGTSDFCLQCTDINEYALSQQQSLLDRVNLEIIGEDEPKLNTRLNFSNGSLIQTGDINKFRVEQRKKLEELKGRL